MKWLFVINKLNVFTIYASSYLFKHYLLQKPLLNSITLSDSGTILRQFQQLNFFTEKFIKSESVPVPSDYPDSWWFAIISVGKVTFF